MDERVQTKQEEKNENKRVKTKEWVAEMSVVESDA